MLRGFTVICRFVCNARCLDTVNRLTRFSTAITPHMAAPMPAPACPWRVSCDTDMWCVTSSQCIFLVCGYLRAYGFHYPGLSECWTHLSVLPRFCMPHIMPVKCTVRVVVISCGGSTALQPKLFIELILGGITSTVTWYVDDRSSAACAPMPECVCFCPALHIKKRKTTERSNMRRIPRRDAK